MEEKYTIIDKLMIALIVFFSFYYLEPFFIWETFAGGAFRKLFGAIPFRTLFGFGIIALWILFYSKIGVAISKIRICSMVLVVAFFTVVLAGGAEKTQVLSFAWLPYFVVITYILLPEKIQRKSYEVFVMLFAITLIMPIVYYTLTHIGISVPYTILESAEEIKVIRGYYYKLYPLATELTNIWDPSLFALRMCGIFDEPGRVGTVAGLILASEGFRIRGNWKNIIILVGAILSFSVAFYAIAIIYYLITCFSKKMYKIIAIVTGASTIFFIFMNIQFSNPNITQFQKRFEYTTEGFVADNRTNADFDGLMNEFYHSDMYSVLFGKGDGAIGEIQNTMNIDGSSFKCMIYNFGFVGYGLSLIWLVLYALWMCKRKGANKTQIFAVLAVYLANMYQRPSVFYMGYMLIFFGGIVLASQQTEEPKQAQIPRKERRRLLSVKSSDTVSNV